MPVSCRSYCLAGRLQRR